MFQEAKGTPGGKTLVIKVIRALSGWTPMRSRNDADAVAGEKTITGYDGDDQERLALSPEGIPRCDTFADVEEIRLPKTSEIRSASFLPGSEMRSLFNSGKTEKLSTENVQQTSGRVWTDFWTHLLF